MENAWKIWMAQIATSEFITTQNQKEKKKKKKRKEKHDNYEFMILQVEYPPKTMICWVLFWQRSTKNMIKIWIPLLAKILWKFDWQIMSCAITEQKQ